MYIGVFEYRIRVCVPFDPMIEGVKYINIDEN